MYPRADWYQPVDTVILTFLSDHRFRMVVPPIVIAINSGISATHANRRIKILHDAGLVEEPKPMGKSGYYRITDLGERVALGAVDSEEIEELDPDDPRSD